ncbi:hypothetical protein GF325_18635 [Candidatus Bathyarchaeota archaeon]|nr:hypothetical protein [Candidatus Bathyarchaeota archaeon]
MSGESTGAESIQVEHGTIEAPERSRNWKIYIMPFLIAFCLVVVFYSIQNAINGLEEGVIQLQILFGFLDMLLAFFFGFFVFGFIGIIGAKLQFPIHRFFRRNKKRVECLVSGEIIFKIDNSVRTLHDVHELPELYRG